MKTIASASAALLLAFGTLSATALADVGPYDPPGWYLEGPGVRAGPFGSQGLCQDIRNRQSGGAQAQCVLYDRYYWLVTDAGMGRIASVTSMPFMSLAACMDARARMAARSGRNLMCTRRMPDIKPPPGTASLPGTQTATLARQ